MSNKKEIEDCIEALMDKGPTGFSMVSRDYVHLQNEFNLKNKDRFFNFLDELELLLIKYNCTIEGNDACIQLQDFRDFFEEKLKNEKM